MSEKTVFVSYRLRDPSGRAYSHLIREKLTQRGYDVFHDVVSMKSGKWPDQIRSEIHRRAHFLLLLTPKTLDGCANEGDWVRKEFLLAVAHRRNVVLVLEESVTTTELKRKCPPEMLKLFEYQGIVLKHDGLEACFDTLVERYIAPQHAPTAPTIPPAWGSDPTPHPSDYPLRSLIPQAQDIQNLNTLYANLKKPSYRRKLSAAVLPEFAVQLFSFAGVAPMQPFTADGDDVTGAFVHRHMEYSLGLAWHNRLLTATDLERFRGRLSAHRRHGLLIAIRGFADDVLTRPLPHPELLLGHGEDLDAVLERRISLGEILDAKQAERANPDYVRFDRLLPRYKQSEWSAMLRRFADVTQKELRALGAKYRPSLYVNREAETRLDDFIRTEENRPSLALVIERAGSGKTNLLCHLADRYSRTHPVFFVRAGTQLDSTMGLPALLNRLYAEVGTAGRGAATAASEVFVLDTARLAFFHRKKVILLIDGINESRTAGLLKDELLAALARWRGLPVVFVVTCRDIYWGAFADERWAVYQDAKASSHNRMYHFNDAEYDQAVRRYFAHYRIRGRLDGPARERCRHPLLLMFFCKAHENEDVGVVRDILLLDLFDLYWRRKIEEPFQETHRVEGGGPGARCLYDITREMLLQKTGVLGAADIHRVVRDPKSDDRSSPYSKLLDEYVILQREASATSHVTVVKFVYEEFMEYVVARYILEETAALQPHAVVAYVTNFIRNLPGFLKSLGVMVFLALLLKARRKISIWRLLIDQNDGRWSAVLFDALRRLSEDGLDESTDELLCELMADKTKPEVCVQALELCRASPYCGRTKLADAVDRCIARTELPVRLAALRTAALWSGRRFHTVIERQVVEKNLAACSELAEVIAEGDHQLTDAFVYQLLDLLLVIDNNDVRARTAIALASLDSDRALRKLKALVETSNSAIRKLIADECRQFQHRPNIHPAACNLLERLCKDLDPAVAERGVTVYGTYDQDRSVRYLMGVVAGSNQQRLRTAALNGLVEYAGVYCRGKRVSVPEPERAAKIEALCKLCAAAPPGATNLLTALAVPPASAGYLVHLAAIGGGEAVRLLIPLVNARSKLDSLTVVLREVPRIADQVLIDQIVALTTFRTAAVRSLAIETLGRIAHPNAVTALIGLLGGEDKISAGKALEALLVLGSQVESRLIETVREERLDALGRERLAFELRRFPPDVARNTLIRLIINDPNPEVKRVAEESLEALLER